MKQCDSQIIFVSYTLYTSVPFIAVFGDKATKCQVRSPEFLEILYELQAPYLLTERALISSANYVKSRLHPFEIWHCKPTYLAVNTICGQDYKKLKSTSV